MMEFIKMHVSGNDFMIIDKGKNPEFDIDSIDVQDLGDRRKGIGFDQLLTIDKFQHENAKISIYNSDGSTAETCINGTMCVAKYLMKEKYLEKVFITSDNRTFEFRNEENSFVEFKLQSPSFSPKDSPINKGFDNLNLKILDDFGITLSLGNPHLVVFIHEKSDLDKLELFVNFTQKDRIFKNDVNVSVVYIENDKIYAITWERGVGRTLSCGSAACCIYFAAQKKILLNNQAYTNFEIIFPGGKTFINSVSKTLFAKVDFTFLGKMML